MATPTDLLTLAQWLSPAFPLGSFAYSHGLESAVDRKRVTDGIGFADWLEAVLEFGSGASDALFLAAAFHGDAAAVDAEARAFAASAERLAETVQQGAAFVAVTSAVWGTPAVPRVLPVAVGEAARLQGLPLCETLVLYLHAFAANLTAAAQRLLPLGQTEAQRIVAGLAPLIRSVAEEAECGDLDRLSATCFLADIAAMQHETQYSRIFRS